MELEDRLWRQLERAAERQARRGRLSRGAAATRAALPVHVLRPAVIAVAALLLGAGAIVALNRPQPPATPHWRIDTFALEGSRLSGGVTAFGSLWTYDLQRGQVVRVDADARRIVARVPVPGDLADVAVAAGAGAVWAVNTPLAAVPLGRDGGLSRTPLPTTSQRVALVRIDPATNRITGSVTPRLSGGATLAPLGLVARPGAIWVWGAGGALRIDPGTLRVTREITAPGDSLMGFTATDTDAFAVTVRGRFLGFDAGSGERTLSRPTRSPTRALTLIALPGAVVRDEQNGSFASLDARTGRTLWTASPGESVRDGTLTAGRLWIVAADPASPHDALLGFDPGTGRIVARIALPVTDTRAVAAAGDTLLLTTQSGAILRLSP
jgi:hypothetical protein